MKKRKKGEKEQDQKKKSLINKELDTAYHVDPGERKSEKSGLAMPVPLPPGRTPRNHPRCASCPTQEQQPSTGTYVIS